MNVDLNADVGESYGRYSLGHDESLLRTVTSVNIACGFHAGDPGVMRRTVELAARQGVQIGAHPGLSDLLGFGRREMDVTAQEVYDLTLYQIGALEGFVRAAGATLHHVKAHGALYSMAARRFELALAVVQAVRDVSPTLIVYGLAGSAFVEATRTLGQPLAQEVFADRSYTAQGFLTPRGAPGALLGEHVGVAQALRMAQQGTVVATDGSVVSVQADTICLHGDGVQAVQTAQALRATLEAHGVHIASPVQPTASASEQKKVT